LSSKRTDDLAVYRIEKAKNDLEAAKGAFSLKFFENSINRSYYSIFHAARALLALEGIDFKKHSGVINHFIQFYIKTNLFDSRFSNIIKDAFAIRRECDYEDFFIITKEDVEKQLIVAEEFVTAIEDFVNKSLQKK
jgi:uncharacterized protein (UPF0332 family)